MAPSWDRKRAAHLYRRAGFGGTRRDLDLAVSLGREGAVSHLVDYDGISTADLDAYLDLFGFNLAGYPGGLHDEREYFLSRWWYLRMQHGPRPLQEKMTLFWHNHFATSFVKVEQEQLMYAQNQIFRSLGMGRFGDLLLAVSRDPAMLIYLDNASNVKGSPNENFAREVMELFTMGHGNYTQQDVTEAARAFTGWTIDAANHNQFVFDPDAHDDGFKSFLGQYGLFRGEDIVAVLGRAPRDGRLHYRQARALLSGQRPVRRSRKEPPGPVRLEHGGHPSDRPGDSAFRRVRPDRGCAGHDQVAHRARRRSVPVAGSRVGRGGLQQLLGRHGPEPLLSAERRGLERGTDLDPHAGLPDAVSTSPTHSSTRSERYGDLGAFTNFRWDISRFFDGIGPSRAPTRSSTSWSTGSGWSRRRMRCARRCADISPSTVPSRGRPIPSTTTSSGAGRSIS